MANGTAVRLSVLEARKLAMVLKRRAKSAAAGGGRRYAFLECDGSGRLLRLEIEQAPVASARVVTGPSQLRTPEATT